jgi:hypothetical protein
MKNQFLIFFIFSLFATCLTAQTSIQITDIAVSPRMEIDTITGLPVEDNTENLSVMFKINDISLAENVYVLIGTAENTGDVMSIAATVNLFDSEYFLEYGGNSYAINDNVVEAQLRLDETQLASFTHITAYVTDSQEQETEHLVFTK